MRRPGGAEPDLAVRERAGERRRWVRRPGRRDDADPVDGDDHAAVERLACYTYFGARGLPADGGVAVLTARLSASRSRMRKAALDARVLDTCPTCYLVLPAQGGCNNCD